MYDWLDPPALPPPPELVRELGLSPWIAVVLAQRGFAEPALARRFLDPAQYVPAPPEDLPNLETAADRLQRAIEDGERILVWGDFDVDGQTATALLVEALQTLGGRVQYHIPVRAQESHGVSPAVLRRWLAAAEPPGLILTCDTGIAACEAAEVARSQGVDLLISDHHELPVLAEGGLAPLPAAQAIVTPRFLPPGHPLAALPGVGVAYKLAEALLARAGRPEAAVRLLDLVALGIVADVAQQTGDTRYLLQRGLAQLRTTPRSGLQAIYESAEFDPQGLSEEHIGFVLAPRLNALGRLGDANPAVELLTTLDRGRARLLAVELEGLNARRQLLTSQVLRGALAQLQRDRALLEEAALVLANPAWEPGVIGIVASRLVEMYGKPVVMIAAPPGGPGRASARSVPGVDITRAIASQADLLLGYGGHAMAAGFSIPLDNIPAFRRRLNRTVAATQAKTPFERKPLQIDAYLPWEALSLEIVAEIERLAPFGPGNPPLTLASRGLRLVSQAALGRQQEHLQLTIEDANAVVRQVIWWNAAEVFESRGLPQGLFDLAYQARPNNYRGKPGLQIEFLDDRPLAEGSDIAPGRPLVEDYRLENHPLPILQRLVAEPGDRSLRIWAEAEAAKKLAERVPAELVGRRDELAGPLHTLVIWTSPASAADLQAVLLHTQPERAALFAVDPDEESLPAFLERLAGLARYALSRPERRATLSRLAAATAQRELTVLRGLEWLAAQGRLSLRQEAGELILAPGGTADLKAADQLLEQIRDLLDETRAYRAYYRRAVDLNINLLDT
jgi:single-stranded-DNA-specific exonuclease